MWAWPINPTVVTDEFGNRFHPIDKVWRLHAGIDLLASTGQIIKAAGDGVITWAGYNGGEGNSVHVQHPDNSKTKYFHGISIHQHSGVVRGNVSPVIGAGSTGASTGTHLHFECHNAPSYSPVNPREFMAARGVPFGGASPAEATPNPLTEEDDDMAPKLILHIVRHPGKPDDTNLLIQTVFGFQDGNNAAVRDRVFRPYGGVPAPIIYYEDEIKTLEGWMATNRVQLRTA